MMNRRWGKTRESRRGGRKNGHTPPPLGGGGGWGNEAGTSTASDRSSQTPTSKHDPLRGQALAASKPLATWRLQIPPPARHRQLHRRFLLSTKGTHHRDRW